MSRSTVRIGGNAAGPVVVGDDNRVEVHQAAPEPEPAESGPVQINIAKDHGTLFAAQEGSQDVDQDGSGGSEEG
ncbi:hypothetical protein OG301_38205 [Streptomyces platensis]|uniref:hypothetical protein n=1 Tax=Streptomyces platensis TaxID=58346 RepID=UPI002E8133CB|nr:hypothetical protein [Streptomyces platensis]WTI56701.1 hypothetical protein OG301_38205 [Streptomyces platensis]WUB77802.1 hypothetical protein OG424_00490 [Streptomyces platensis]